MAVVPRRSRYPEGVPQIHSMVHGNLKGSGLEVEAGTWDLRVRQPACAVSPLSPARCRKMAPTRADNFTRVPNPESSNAASSSGRMRTLHQVRGMCSFPVTSLISGTYLWENCGRYNGGHIITQLSSRSVIANLQQYLAASSVPVSLPKGLAWFGNPFFKCHIRTF